MGCLQVIGDALAVQHLFRVRGEGDRQLPPGPQDANGAEQKHQQHHRRGKAKHLQPQRQPQDHERSRADRQHQRFQGHTRLLTGTATAAVSSSSRLSGLTAFMRASGVSWMRWLSTGLMSCRTSSGST